MKLVAGLGNPGREYEGTPHNVGFQVVDLLMDKLGISGFQRKFQSQLCRTSVEGEDCILIKPQTYMNKSGQAVAECASFYKIPVENTIVIHDEIDLAPAKVQLKKGGGFAGHKGLESIGHHVGNDFYRIRVGVGHPGEKDLVSGYVLSNFSKDDNQWVSKILRSVSEQIETAILGDENKFNQKMSDGFNTGVSDVTTKIEK